MVGSVLMQRMIEERDFDHVEPVFFSTSRAGGDGPAIGQAVSKLQDAGDPKAFARLDAIVTCQGSDWTHAMYAKLRAAGFDGYWIDAANALRMTADAVIILDPVNRPVIDAALARGIRNYIGGNCTVSLMLMGLAGLFKHGLVEWMTCMTYQAASGAGAQNMRELLQQMGEAHLAAKALLDDPASSILDIDREVAGILRDDRFPTEHIGVPLAGSLIPWIDKDLGNGMSKEERKGGAEANKILGRGNGSGTPAIPIESLCVSVGAMRCNSQALTRKLAREFRLEVELLIAGGNDWVRVVPNTRDESIRRLTPAAVTGRLEIPVGRLRKLAMGSQYLSAFTCGDQLLWGAAEPLRRMLRIISAMRVVERRRAIRRVRVSTDDRAAISASLSPMEWPVAHRPPPCGANAIATRFPRACWVQYLVA
jgi:aspartate-semialdehyde dehydrogenase